MQIFYLSISWLLLSQLLFLSLVVVAGVGGRGGGGEEEYCHTEHQMQVHELAREALDYGSIILFSVYQLQL